jgi:superfamily I DNA/RNA helicase
LTKIIKAVFHNIKYHFNTTLKKLVELSKSCAIDPRREFEEISIEFDEVLNDYDLTTVFDEIVYSAVINEINKINRKNKDVINPERRDAIIWAVSSINKKHKNIINFNYHEAISKACHLVLKESLPRNTTTVNIKNKRNGGNEEYELGQLCDFDDWLWWPAIMAREVAWPSFNCVLLDEVQDFNRCQLIIVQELAKRGAKIIAVGDKNQAIYRFRGADGEIFDKIHRFLQNDTNRSNNNMVIDIKYGLQVNYRCAKNVIDFVNEKTVIKDLIACDTAVEGIAEYKDLNSDKLFEFLKENDDRTAILSRVNHNVSVLLLEFLKRGIPFTSKRDAGKRFEIIQHLQKEARDFCEEHELYFYRISTQDFIREATIILAVLEGSVRNYEFDVDEIREKITSYKFLLELIAVLNINIFFNGTYGLNNLLERLDLYIEEQSKLHNAVIMMTIHASKGSEYDTVVMIDDDSIPLKRLRLEADIIQEENLRYVGYTRAKKKLIVCNQVIAANNYEETQF